MHVFKFPKDFADFHVSFGLHDLKRKLSLHEDNYTDLRLKDIYDVKEACINHNYVLYAKCKHCKSHIKYKKQVGDPDQYKLHKYDNLHQHVIQKTDVSRDMVQYLRMAFGKIPQQLLRSYFMEKFEKKGATQRQYEKAFEIAKKDYEKKAFIEELQEFGKRNFMSMIKKSHINMHPDEKNLNKQHYPIFLFLSTPEMKALYQRFGKIVYVHRFPYLIPKDTLNSQEWMVLVFSGIDNFNSIIFYGFAICYGLNPLIASLTFQSFFQHFPLEKCETLVTENEDVFNKGFTQFLEQESKKRNQRVRIIHLWDLMLDLKDASEERKKVQRKLIVATSEKQFQGLVTDYRQKIKPPDGTKFEMFLSKSPKYCLLRVPNTFVGISLGLDHFQEIFNSITKNFPKEEEYNVFVFRFTTYLNETKLIRGSTNLLTKILITPLADCYAVASEYALNHLYDILIEANMVNFYPNQGKNKIKIGHNQVTITRNYDKPKKMPVEALNKDKEHQMQIQNSNVEYGTPFSQIPFLKDQLKTQKAAFDARLTLQCDCNMKKKTGLPCAHIMRICLYYGIPISTQIDQFWDARKQLQIEDLQAQRQIIYHKMVIEPKRRY